MLWQRSEQTEGSAFAEPTHAAFSSPIATARSIGAYLLPGFEDAIATVGVSVSMASFVRTDDAGQNASRMPPPKLRMFNPGAGVVFTGTLSDVTGS